MNDNDGSFRTGTQLLAEWGCKTREQKLERACMALMEQLNQLHQDRKECSLAEHLTDADVSCSCADAYRMGHAALTQDDGGQVVTLDQIDDAVRLRNYRRNVMLLAECAASGYMKLEITGCQHPDSHISMNVVREAIVAECQRLRAEYEAELAALGVTTTVAQDDR